MAMKIHKNTILALIALVIAVNLFFPNALGYIVGVYNENTLSGICPNKAFQVQVGITKADIQKSRMCWDGNTLLSNTIDIRANATLLQMTLPPHVYLYSAYGRCNCMEGCQLPVMLLTAPYVGDNWLLLTTAFDKNGNNLTSSGMYVQVRDSPGCADKPSGALPEVTCPTCTPTTPPKPDGDPNEAPVSPYTICTSGGCVGYTTEEEMTNQVDALIVNITSPPPGNGGTGGTGGQPQDNSLYTYLAVGLIVAAGYLLFVKR